MQRMQRFSLTGVMLIAGWGLLNAQPYRWTAKVSAPQKDGYHQILLSPAVTAQMAEDLVDIRLYDSTGTEVPYVFKQQIHSSRILGFTEFPIVEKDYNSSWQWESRFIIQTPEKPLLDRLYLSVANFEARKKVRLSGSDDKKQWFVIKDGYVMYGASNDTSASSITVLAFPKSQYEYYKIEIDDYWKKDPINLLAVGTTSETYNNGTLQSIEGIRMAQSDSLESKASHIAVDLGGNHFFDKIRLDFADQGNYYRRVVFSKKVWTSDSTFVYNSFRDKWISSTSLNEFIFRNERTEEIRMVIENKDDQPLKLISCTVFQLKSHLVGKLDASQNYSIQFGNDTLPRPEYDLIYFQNEIPKELPELSVYSLLEKPKEEDLEEKIAMPFLENPVAIWSLIGLVILLLGYVSVKMLKDVKQNDA